MLLMAGCVSTFCLLFHPDHGTHGRHQLKGGQVSGLPGSFSRGAKSVTCSPVLEKTYAPEKT